MQSVAILAQNAPDKLFRTQLPTMRRQVVTIIVLFWKADPVVAIGKPMTHDNPDIAGLYAI